MQAKLVAHSLPKKSPDLNVLDYCLRNAVNRRMHAQERAYRKDRNETKEQLQQRLKKTALNLPTSLVKAAVGSMRRRCRAISDCNGDLFTE